MNPLSGMDQKKIYDETYALAPHGVLTEDLKQLYFATVDTRAIEKELCIEMIEINFKNGDFEKAIQGVDDLYRSFSLNFGEIQHFIHGIRAQSEKNLQLLQQAQTDFQMKKYSKVKTATREILTNFPEQKEAKALLQSAVKAAEDLERWANQFSQNEALDEARMALLYKKAREAIAENEKSKQNLSNDNNLEKPSLKKRKIKPATTEENLSQKKNRNSEPVADFTPEELLKLRLSPLVISQSQFPELPDQNKSQKVVDFTPEELLNLRSAPLVIDLDQYLEFLVQNASQEVVDFTPEELLKLRLSPLASNQNQHSEFPDQNESQKGGDFTIEKLLNFRPAQLASNQNQYSESPVQNENQERVLLLDSDWAAFRQLVEGKQDLTPHQSELQTLLSKIPGFDLENEFQKDAQENPIPQERKRDQSPPKSVSSGAAKPEQVKPKKELTCMQLLDLMPYQDKPDLYQKKVEEMLVGASSNKPEQAAAKFQGFSISEILKTNSIKEVQNDNPNVSKQGSVFFEESVFFPEQSYINYPPQSE